MEYATIQNQASLWHTAVDHAKKAADKIHDVDKKNRENWQHCLFFCGDEPKAKMPFNYVHLFQEVTYKFEDWVGSLEEHTKCAQLGTICNADQQIRNFKNIETKFYRHH